MANEHQRRFSRMKTVCPVLTSALRIARIASACSAVLFFVAIAIARHLPPDDSLITNSVYEKNCAKCHGKTAQGRTFAGPSLANARTAATSANDLRNIILNGKGHMPKFAGKLSADEIENLVNQIKMLNDKR